MKLRYSTTCALLAALSACGPQHQQEAPAANESAPTIPAPSAPPAVTNNAGEAEPTAPAQAPANPAVDPKSTQAALNIAQKFADLLNQRKFDEAYMLLGPNGPSRSEFLGMWGQFDSLTVKVGKPGQQEGAAGSIYLSVPLEVSGVGHGEGIRGSDTLVLRRVNDVPGSTEQQRQWHIERIEPGSGR
ncbi:MAG: hypothetical protein ACM3ZV_03485 [Bacillota bacterium]